MRVLIPTSLPKYLPRITRACSTASLFQDHPDPCRASISSANNCICGSLNASNIPLALVSSRRSSACIFACPSSSS